MKVSGAKPSVWKFFREMDDFLGGNADVVFDEVMVTVGGKLMLQIPSQLVKYW